MASITVAAFKAAVASIPAGANTWLIQIPDDTAWEVVTGRTVAPNGDITQTVRGYLSPPTLSWTPVQ